MAPQTDHTRNTFFQFRVGPSWESVVVEFQPCGIMCVCEHTTHLLTVLGSSISLLQRLLHSSVLRSWTQLGNTFLLSGTRQYHRLASAWHWSGRTDWHQPLELIHSNSLPQFSSSLLANNYLLLNTSITTFCFVSMRVWIVILNKVLTLNALTQAYVMLTEQLS